VENVMSLLSGGAAVVLGEGVRLFEIQVPASVSGKPLGVTGIGSRTGLSVVAMEQGGTMMTTLNSETVLPREGKLLMLGSDSQRRKFAEEFENSR
jgi:K+/H+ antiporter YhaU regulatory subunit KhtT